MEFGHKETVAAASQRCAERKTFDPLTLSDSIYVQFSVFRTMLKPKPELFNISLYFLLLTAAHVLMYTVSSASQ